MADTHHDDHHHDDPSVHQAPWVTVLTLAITFGLTGAIILLKMLV